MALLESERTAIGTPLEVDVRGRRVAAEVCPLPFYRRAK
jgi:aminomethyltransferase